MCEDLVRILHICDYWVPIVHRCEELVPILHICENWVPIRHIWEKSNQSFEDDTNTFQFFTVKMRKMWTLSTDVRPPKLSQLTIRKIHIFQKWRIGTNSSHGVKFVKCEIWCSTVLRLLCSKCIVLANYEKITFQFMLTQFLLILSDSSGKRVLQIRRRPREYLTWRVDTNCAWLGNHQH